MSDIDPTRLSAIFRTLSSKDLQKTNEEKNNANESTTSSRSLSIQKTAIKDKEYLKKNIKQRISALKKLDVNFEDKVPIITIQEILLWEFGEDIMNHPDFNHLSLSITEKVKENNELMIYLKSLTSEIK